MVPLEKFVHGLLVACDLADHLRLQLDRGAQRLACLLPARLRVAGHVADAGAGAVTVRIQACVTSPRLLDVERQALGLLQQAPRSEEHTSELQSLMRISYAVFCLKKKKHNTHQ